MGNLLFTSTGCARCKIVKQFMAENGIVFQEKDIKAAGREEFKKFYSANRSSIFRGPDGLEFPIFTDGKEIRQGIGAAVAYLSAGKKLDGFFQVGILHKEWVDGISISAGSPEYGEEFLEVLRFLKRQAMKLQVATDGRNSQLLKRMLEESLADVVVMDVLGPAALYSQIVEAAVNVEDVKRSLALIVQFPQYRLQTMIRPVLRQVGNSPEIAYLTPAEITETARLIAEGTGSKKNPYLLRQFKQELTTNEIFKSLEPIASLLPYRTAARAYQVLTDVEKG